MKIVFDTYAWIEYFKGTSKGNFVSKYLSENDVLTPSIVLLELSYRADQEGWIFTRFLNFIKDNSQIIGLNESFILSFGKLYNGIKRQVRNISMADIIIIHTARMSNAEILTGDKHFKKIDNVIML